MPKTGQRGASRKGYLIDKQGREYRNAQNKKMMARKEAGFVGKVHQKEARELESRVNDRYEVRFGDDHTPRQKYPTDKVDTRPPKGFKWPSKK